MSPVDRREDLLRACYEGIVFTHRWHIQRLLQNRDQPAAIRLAGGIVHSQVWVQLFADILQFPVEIVEAEDIGGCGLGIVSGVAAGEFPDYPTAVEQCVRVKRTVYPRREYREIYDIKYQRYLDVAQKMGYV